MLVDMSKSPTIFRKAIVEDDAPKLEIDRKIRSLNQHRAATVLEIIALERAGHKREPISATPTVDERAAGFLGDVEPGKRKALSNLDADLAAIDRALAIAGTRSANEHSRLAETLVEQRAPAWADLARRRALAVAALLRLNAEADDFVQEIAEAAGHRPFLPFNFPSHRLLGRGDEASGPAHDFLNEAVKQGFISSKDLRNA